MTNLTFIDIHCLDHIIIYVQLVCI